MSRFLPFKPGVGQNIGDDVDDDDDDDEFHIALFSAREQSLPSTLHYDYIIEYFWGFSV